MFVNRSIGLFDLFWAAGLLHLACCLYDDAEWSSHNLRVPENEQAGIRNPNLLSICPPKDDPSATNNPYCQNGGYIYNPDPDNCGDTFKCYLGEDDFCEDDMECLGTMVCTCGRCRRERGMWCREELAAALMKVDRDKGEDYKWEKIYMDSQLN